LTQKGNLQVLYPSRRNATVVKAATAYRLRSSAGARAGIAALLIQQDHRFVPPEAVAMQTQCRTLFPILALLAAILPLTARAQDATVRRALEREYARYDRLLEQQDAKGQLANFRKILAPGFTFKDGAGRVTTREQMLRDLEQDAKAGPQPSPSPIAEQKTTINKITVQKDTATALVTEKQTRRITDDAGRFGPPAKPVASRRCFTTGMSGCGETTRGRSGRARWSRRRSWWTGSRQDRARPASRPTGRAMLSPSEPL
jgi:hypothetical protein